MTQVSTTSVNKAIGTALLEAESYLSKLANHTVETYWLIGGLAASLDTKYGNETIREFAESLSTRADKQVSVQTVYRMLQFYRKHTRSDLDKILKAGISWTQIIKTLPQAPEVVNATVDKVLADQVNPVDFAKHVANTTTSAPVAQPPADTSPASTEVDARLDGTPQPAPVDQKINELLDQFGTPQQAIKFLQKTTNLIERLNDQLPSVLIIVHAAAKMKDKALDKLLSDFSVALSSLASVGGAAKKSVSDYLNPPADKNG